MSSGSEPAELATEPDVVCVGILVVDVIAGPIDGLPPTGELSLIDEIELHSGGCAANIGMDLARLGTRVEVVGKVGADALGRFLLDELAVAGAGAEGIIADPAEHTSASVILVDGGGERTLLHHYGANAVLREDELDPERLFAGRALHVAGALLLPALDGPPTARLLGMARERGVMTSMNAAYDRTGGWDRVHASLPELDLFTASLIEARATTGRQEPHEIAAWLRERGVLRVAITLGADGCYGASDGYEGFVPAPGVDAVDATGAGDAFAAGVLHGLVGGAGFEVALERGCECGAMTTTVIGATHPELSRSTKSLKEPDGAESHPSPT